MNRETWQISRLCRNHSYMSERAGKGTKPSSKNCASMHFIRTVTRSFIQDWFVLVHKP